MEERRNRSTERNRIVSSILILLTVTAVILIVPSVISDDSDAAVCDNIRVFIEDENGKYEESTVSGVSTVKGAIEAAVKAQNKTITYNDRGNVASVDGRTVDSDHSWRVHQWLPLGTSGWGVMGFDSESDKMMNSGTSYCLHVCTSTNNDGTIVYSIPNFKPVSTGYVFIRFANGFDGDNIDVQNTFTAEIRTEGFWLEGTGSSMGEVLKNAVESNQLDIMLKTGTDSNGNDLQCWIVRMFGLGDELVGDGVWAYWSQWTWVDGEWDYNNWTLGYYDPAVYKYMECIYLISTPDPYGDGYIIDKGGAEPNPYTDEIKCIKNYNEVKFVVDGEVVKETEVKYGTILKESEIPKITVPEGKTLLGWGNISNAITEDTVFTAQFGSSSETVTIRYYYDDAKKILLYTEKIVSGSSAAYSTVPTKAETDEYTYRFTGWSSDLSCVTADTDVTPVFESIPKTHTHSWKTESTVSATCMSSGRTVYVCEICGEKKTETSQALGHSWDSGTTKQPTCTQKGSVTYTCTRCNVQKSESIAALGHSWNNGTTKQPTCTENGSKTYTCYRCNEQKSESIPATGHSWDSGKVKEPTCTETGLKTYTCTECREKKEEIIPAMGHTWSDWVVTEEATPSVLGTREHTCTVCKESETASVLYVNTDGDMEISRDGVDTVVKRSDGVTESVTSVTAETKIADNHADVTIGSSAVAEILKQMSEVSDSVGDVKSSLVISAGDGSFGGVSYTISREDVASLSSSDKLTVKLQSSFGSVTFGNDILSDKSASDGITVRFVSGDTETEEKFSGKVSSGHTVNIDMISGETQIHRLSGTVTLTVKYGLPEGTDPGKISVWYVDGDTLTKVEGSSYDSVKGEMTFTTDHFSSWVIGVENTPSGNGNGMVIYAAIGVIAAVVCAGAVFLFVRKK